MKDNILKDKFSEFYLNEYKMLTEAHFQTSQKITSFFQYALLIFSAPIVLLTAQKGNISDLLKGSVFVFIGIVGILVMLYLSQLRAEALLYARNINKIRKSIYSYLSNTENLREQLEKQA